MKLTMSHGYSIRDKKDNILHRSLSTSRELSRSGITRTLNPARHSHHSDSRDTTLTYMLGRNSEPVQSMPHNPLKKNFFRANSRVDALKSATLYESKIISIVPQYRYKPQKPVNPAPSVHSLLRNSQVQKKKRNDKIPTNLLAA